MGREGKDDTPWRWCLLLVCGLLVAASLQSFSHNESLEADKRHCVSWMVWSTTDSNCMARRIIVHNLATDKTIAELCSERRLCANNSPCNQTSSCCSGLPGEVSVRTQWHFNKYMSCRSKYPTFAKHEAPFYNHDCYAWWTERYRTTPKRGALHKSVDDTKIAKFDKPKPLHPVPYGTLVVLTTSKCNNQIYTNTNTYI